MIFSSFEFIFAFLPMAIAGYYLANRTVNALTGKIWILCCSLFFYGWWNTAYLPLLVGSIVVNYLIAKKISSMDATLRPKTRKIFFIVGVLFNLFLLGYFKYANFFVDNWDLLFNKNVVLQKIILPLGISFFTIQQIAFLVDVYEELVEEKSFLDYALFVTFFPHLLAGPILHHKQMMPQFAVIKTRAFNPANFAVGLFVFSIGLFKKVLLADTLSIWVGSGYSLTSQLSILDAWFSSLSYTFQLYFDFSGYVDMAIGVGLMFNIRLPINFNSPYRASGVINFWERWHITLSKFITTYIYTPLIKNFPGRITFVKSMIATLVAMFIAGLWHGAAWTYVVFGVFHGLGLVVNHIWRKSKIKISFGFSWFITFMFVNVSFVIFRSSSLGQAIEILKTMAGFGVYTGAWFDLHIVEHLSPMIDTLAQYIVPEFKTQLVASVFISFLLGICLLCKNTNMLQENFKPGFLTILFQVLLFVTPLFMMNGVTEFLYFQF